jgi:UDP-glucose 4-epimerase
MIKPLILCTACPRLKRIDGKNVVVAGGAGFLGSHLVDALLGNDCTVTVLDSFERGSTANLPMKHEGLKVNKVDLLDFSEIEDKLNGVDVLFEMAGKVTGNRDLYQSPASLIQINTGITLNVARAALKAEVERVVFASSSCVYDCSNVKVPTKEDDVEFPLQSYYGWSKLMGETIYSAYREQYGLNVGIARIFNAYGPRDSLRSPHVIPEFILKALDLKMGMRKTFDILGDGMQTRSFLYVTDVARGLVKLAESSDCGAFNLGAEQETRIIDLAYLILRKLDVNPEEIKFVHLPINPNDIRKRAADISKAKAILGWEPKVGFDDGLDATLEYYRKMLPLHKQQKD